MLKDGFFDFSWINVFATRFDKLLVCGPPFEPEIAGLIEPTHVAGMVPSVTESVLGILLSIPVTFENLWSTHYNFAGQPRFDDISGAVNHIDFSQMQWESRGTGSFKVGSNCNES